MKQDAMRAVHERQDSQHVLNNRPASRRQFLSAFILEGGLDRRPKQDH